MTDLNPNDDRRVGEALRDLADPSPPASLWGQIEASLPVLTTGTATGPRGWLWVGATAATVLLAMLIASFWEPVRETGVDEPDVRRQPGFSELIAESRALEMWVAPGPAAPGSTRRVLIHRLRYLDAELSAQVLVDAEADRTIRLLEQRVALLRALADVDNRRSVTREQLRPAVYTP